MAFAKMQPVETGPRDQPFDPAVYKLPGEVFFRGVMYNEPFFGPSTIKYVPDFRADPRDVLLAAYPKTGICYKYAAIKQTNTP